MSKNVEKKEEMKNDTATKTNEKVKKSKARKRTIIVHSILEKHNIYSNYICNKFCFPILCFLFYK